MASVDRPKFVDDHFENALCVVCGFVQVESFYPEQVQVLKEFFQEENVFFSVATGHGKSVVLQTKPKFVVLKHS